MPPHLPNHDRIAHIIGLGRSGMAAARLLTRAGYQVVVSDRHSSETLQQQQQQLQGEGITVKLGYGLDLKTLEASERPELIVVSPGVPWDVPLLVQARELGIETIGEMELAWRYLQDIPWVAITGTNGKTTTTALIAAIFQKAGFHAPACGNIGYAACELALAEHRPDWVIAEISSYQIESSATLSPKIGLWTTFTPDHLSRHKTLENYYNIKASLLTQSQQQIFNGDDPYLWENAVSQFPQAIWTSLTGKAENSPISLQDGWVMWQGEQVVAAQSLRMVGGHNQQNLLMAVAAAKLAEIGNEAIAQAVAEFPGVAHRLEQICTIQGIDFINDSKATNYDAAEVGLSSVAAPAILIAGGEAKEGDDTTWLKVIQTKAAAVLLIGDAAEAFAQRLAQVGYKNYTIVKTMDQAVSQGLEMALQHSAKVVLLSPACASFDQYRSFEHRGDHFRQLCWELQASLKS